MRPPTPPPALERIDYVTGCDLLRRDLAGSLTYESRLLALHIAAVHRTWGVGQGLALTLASDSASVSIGSGFGFTCRGDPIVLKKPAIAAAPPEPAKSISRPLFDLILTRTPGPWVSCEAPATCTGDPTPASWPQPTVAWVLAGDAATDPDPPLGPAACNGDAIPLGRFERTFKGTLLGPDPRQRRVARGPTRPYLGVALPGALTWNTGPYSLTAEVDTSSAHFGATPIYLVTLGTNPWVDPTLVGPLASIVGTPSATSFTLQMLFAPSNWTAPITWLNQLAEKANQLTVSWIGIESTVGCSSAGGP